jgi:hypothetical protein
MKLLRSVGIGILLLLSQAGPLRADGEAAYVLAAPNDSTWLALVTREGRFAVQFDLNACTPPQPGTEITLDGAMVRWDSVHVCRVSEALYMDPTPCATRDGQCDVSLEPRG